MHNMELSGGPIFDFSIHFIDFARACLSSEATKFYSGRPTTGRVKSDDQAALLVYYQNGGFGEFTKSWAFPPDVQVGHHSTHVVCREAVIAFGPKIQIHTAEGAEEVTPIEEVAGGRTESYRNLIAAIEESTPLYADEVDWLRAVEILDAALRSRESGQREAVEIHPW